MTRDSKVAPLLFYDNRYRFDYTLKIKRKLINSGIAIHTTTAHAEGKIPLI